MATTKTPAAATTGRPGSLTVSVLDSGSRRTPIRRAAIALFPLPAKFGPAWAPAAGDLPAYVAFTDENGHARFEDIAARDYAVFYGQHPESESQQVTVDAGCEKLICFELDLNVQTTVAYTGPDCQPIACAEPRVGDHANVEVTAGNAKVLKNARIVPPPGSRPVRGMSNAFVMPIRRTGTVPMSTSVMFDPRDGVPGGGAAELVLNDDIADVEARAGTPISGDINVAMTRTETEPTADLRLWGAIRASTEGMSFDRYDAFMEALFCTDNAAMGSPEQARFDTLRKRRFLPFTDTDAYRVMKAATEAFVMVNCGVMVGDQDRIDADLLADFRGWLDRRDLPAPVGLTYRELQDGIPMLPYLAIIRRKLPDVPIGPVRGSDDATDLCDVFIREKLRNPCMLELIWSYWHEESMQVQTMNAVMRRFQNLRGAVDPDPLANVEVNPLRPLNNLIWGYIQDEQHRLSVSRRNAEYDHHYGLRLEGRAVLGFRGADTRSKFVEAFHDLLRLCTEFFRRDDDTTVKADAFGVLNALKEVHLILSQGAHSQFGDLPATARIEMLMQQWLLARPEFREFLPTRVMVAYPEPWMDRVDAMKKVQGWTDTSVIHFHNLAVFGEQILLAIRYGAWSTVFEPTQAFNFARFWRPQIQGYIHAYRAATGVDLDAKVVADKVDATLPSVLLQRRLAAQQRRSA